MVRKDISRVSALDPPTGQAGRIPQVARANHCRPDGELAETIRVRGHPRWPQSDRQYRTDPCGHVSVGTEVPTGRQQIARSRGAGKHCAPPCLGVVFHQVGRSARGRVRWALDLVSVIKPA